MVATMRIGPIAGIHLLSIERGIPRVVNDLEIPGGRSRVQARGTTVQSYTLECEVIESTRLAGEQKMVQLVELADNPDLPFHYIEFPDTETVNSGFFIIEDLRLPREPDLLGTYVFQLRARRIGGMSEYDIAMWWSWAKEKISGSMWGNSPNVLQTTAGLPNGCTYITEITQDPEFDLRLGADGGINPLAADIQRSVIRFRMSSNIADWYKAECAVFDTVTAGNTDEGTWVRVFSPAHTFSGDCIIQNNLLRYNLAASTFYVFDTVSNPMGWVSIGTLRVLAYQPTTITAFEIVYLTPEEVRWCEIRQFDDSHTIVQLEYTMQRGKRHCKIIARTFGETIIQSNGIFLEGTGYFVYIFNNNYYGVGSIELPVSNLYYHCGYSTARNVVAGFVLCDQPAKQPVASGNLYQLMQSNVWGTNDRHVFFIIGWPQAGLTYPVPDEAKIMASFICGECMCATRQEQVLIARGFYA